MSINAIFDRTASFDFGEKSPSILHVPINGYGIWTSGQDTARYAYTHHTADCTGLAMVAQNENIAAMAHVFSNEAFIDHSRTTLETHARMLWEEINQHLPTDTKFTAVAFGAQRSSLELEAAKNWPMDLIKRAAVSQCISDAFIQAALDSGIVELDADIRFQESPHDCLIDMQQREIYVARMRDDLRSKIDFSRATEDESKKFSCNLDIHPLALQVS